MEGIPTNLNMVIQLSTQEDSFHPASGPSPPFGSRFHLRQGSPQLYKGLVDSKSHGSSFLLEKNQGHQALSLFWAARESLAFL